MLDQATVTIKEERLNQVGSFIAHDDEDFNSPKHFNSCNGGVFKTLTKLFRGTSSQSLGGGCQSSDQSLPATPRGLGRAGYSGFSMSMLPDAHSSFSMSTYPQQHASGFSSATTMTPQSHNSPNGLRPSMDPTPDGVHNFSPLSPGGENEFTAHLGAARSDVIKCVRDTALTILSRDSGALPDWVDVAGESGLLDALPQEAAEDFTRTGDWGYVAYSGLSLATFRVERVNPFIFLVEEDPGEGSGEHRSGLGGQWAARVL
eukprot:g4560.t1